jgi:hypothetical protein
MSVYTIRIKSPKSYDRFVWTTDEADAIFGIALKFNPYHHPAGDERGGEFTSADDLGAGVVSVTDRLGNKVNVTKDSSLSKWLVQRPDGSWGIDPTRELLHQQIVNHFLDGVKRQDGQMELFMTGGGPASGKSSILVGGDKLPDAGDAVNVNPDLIKDMLPEYQVLVAAGDRMAATYVHEESSLIRKRLEAAAIAGNYNVILDTTGDSSVDKLTSNLSAYRNAGYKINAYYATNDPDLAVQLAESRGERTGRYVPESVLRTAHEDVSRTFPAAASAGVYDHYELYDTNIQGQPRLVASGDGPGDPHVADPALWNTFLDKGNTAHKADGDHVGTDVLARIVVAITNGTPKTALHLNSRGAQLWDKIAAEIKNCPKGQVVDPGDELSGDDLTNLYSGPLVVQKFATTAGAINVENTQWVPIKKTNDEKQIVYGEVYAPWVLDTYGEFMTTEDIEVMAHRFMQLDLTKVIDTQHDNRPNGCYPVESFIAREGDPDYTPGSWVLGVHVPDAGLWDAVKKGMLNGFSFQSLVKPTSVDVEITAIRDFVGETDLSEDHSHTFFVELDEIGNVIGGRTSQAADGHSHEIQWASVTSRTNGHSHRFFL